MSNDVLFEIGIEELPARFIDQAKKQLEEKTIEWLTNLRIEFKEMNTYATPRRLAVLIKGIAEEQKTIEEEIRGPQLSIAKDENGEWTKAAIGFTKGQGLTVEDIYTKEEKGMTYVYVNKKIEGQQTFHLLADFVEIIKSIHFPQTMRWEASSFRFPRPIRWLVALYNDKVIPFQIAQVETNNITFGHRFLGGKVQLSSPKNYEQILLEQFVIVDPEKREEMIVEGMRAIEKKEGFQIEVAPSLLNEVRNLVEYPTVFFGTFPKDFLKLPSEVLITSMQEHQRYFPVKSTDGSLLPYFIGVRNGDESELQNVIKGNEKVLKARLADGVFFFEEDQKNDIDFYMNKLKTVIFQEKIGTIYEKVVHVQKISKKLSELLLLDEDTKRETLRAAEICKFDLMTGMVGEFPELQGTMGEKYALLFNESPNVAKAIKEHYYPLHANGTLPTTVQGAVVSVADKLDTIVSILSVGLIPTGSTDPYSLRRQAIGIVRTMEQYKWDISLEQLIDYTIDLYDITDETTIDKIYEFFKARIAYILSNNKVEQDVIKAVLFGEIGNVSYVIDKAKLLSEKRSDESFRTIEQSLVRVMNLGKKHMYENIEPDLFVTPSERTLYESYIKVKKQFTIHHTDKNATASLNELSLLADDITIFFEHNMVMDDNPAIKENRLALLHQITKLIEQFADLTCIEWNK